MESSPGKICVKLKTLKLIILLFVNTCLIFSLENALSYITPYKTGFKAEVIQTNSSLGASMSITLKINKKRRVNVFYYICFKLNNRTDLT